MVDAQLNINLFDAIVYTVLFFAAIISLYRGFIREFLSLLTWFGAGLITLALAKKSTEFMLNYIDSGMGAALVGVMGTYFLAVVTLGMIARLLSKYVKSGSDVGWVDNALGLMFGLIKGGMVIVLGFILMTLIFKEDGYPEWVQTASTLPTVQKASIAVVRMMPEYLGSISSLRGGEENKPSTLDALTPGIFSSAPEQPADPDQLIGQEVVPQAQQPLNEEQLKQGTNALEQLIRDVTKDRPMPEDY